MSYLLYAVSLLFVVTALRLAAAIWLASHKTDDEVDKILRIFNGLTAFDAVGRVVESWKSNPKPPSVDAPKDDA